MIKNGTKISVVFTIVGFVCIFLSAYGYEIDHDLLIAIPLVFGVISLALALGFLGEAVLEKKDEEQKQD